MFSRVADEFQRTVSQVTGFDQGGASIKVVVRPWGPLSRLLGTGSRVLCRDAPSGLAKSDTNLRLGGLSRLQRLLKREEDASINDRTAVI